MISIMNEVTKAGFKSLQCRLTSSSEIQGHQWLYQRWEQHIRTSKISATFFVKLSSDLSKSACGKWCETCKNTALLLLKGFL